MLISGTPDYLDHSWVMRFKLSSSLEVLKTFKASKFVSTFKIAKLPECTSNPCWADRPNTSSFSQGGWSRRRPKNRQNRAPQVRGDHGHPPEETGHRPKKSCRRRKSGTSEHRYDVFGSSACASPRMLGRPSMLTWPAWPAWPA